MSVLVYAEHAEGKFRKSAYEAVSYGYELAKMLSGELTAIAIGDISDQELKNLSKYGAKKILHVSADNLKNFSNQAYSAVIAEAANSINAAAVILSATFSGKGLAPRIAVKLKAGLAAGAIALPDVSNGFTVRKSVFSGKAFALVSILTEKKVITLTPNAYKIIENAQQAEIINHTTTINEAGFSESVKESIRKSDKVTLPEAAIVVSGGRGLKGPENWGMIEELAALLEGATACSKPVSDAGWRPHSEHVGQTGLSISPDLYVAVGISGAIQHLAGVSSSKNIVVINKDPEAPFFKAADYGVVGDAFEIVPKLIEAIKKFKAINA